MADCTPAEPQQFQEVYQCIEGSMHSRRQQLFVCTIPKAPSSWFEWHDVGDWRDTGVPC